MSKPILLFGYGNPSRGDDALGPLLVDCLQHHVDHRQVDLLTDFQLQVEHVLDLQHRELVIFADAAIGQSEAFKFTPLEARKDYSYSSHAMSPQALLLVYQNVTGYSPPPSYLLSIKAESFELGDNVSIPAAHNLREACDFIEQLLAKPLAEILDEYA